MPDNPNFEIGSEFFVSQVSAELFRLKVKDEARRQYEREIAGPLRDHPGVLAYDPLPPESPELIEGLLLTHGATGIIAEKETGKSLVALEIQASLLSGEPLWGAIRPAKVLPKTVHFLAEHTSTTLQQLYHRTKLPHAGDLRIFGPEHLGGHKLLVTNGQRKDAAVENYKRLAEGAGLVVFDPLASFIQGEKAESDNAPMRHLIDTMIEIANSTGAACLVLGHQGKPTMHQGRAVKRTKYAARGASAVEDALTAVHYMEHLDGQEIGDSDSYEIRPIHFKGTKAKPFKLVRDRETCRQQLLSAALRRAY